MVNIIALSSSKWRSVFLIMAAMILLGTLSVVSPAPVAKAACSISCSESEDYDVPCNAECGAYLEGYVVVIAVYDCSNGNLCYVDSSLHCLYNCGEARSLDDSYAALNTSGGMPETVPCPVPATLIAFSDTVFIA